jgi:hypothetical protein
MPSLSLPYLYVEALKSRFVQDLADAAQASRISEQERQWLQRLADPVQIQSPSPRFRVDRLLIDDAVPIDAELASAVLIADVQTDNTAVYLNTLLNGLERFDDRQQLLDALDRRFAPEEGDLPEYSYGLIEGDLFEQRMLAIVDQQARYVQLLIQGLQHLPSLRTVLSHTLQRRINASVPDASINVFSHLLQIVVEDPGAAPVVISSQTLAEAAMHAYVSMTLKPGLRRQFLDAQGRVLSGEQARPYEQALTDLVREVPQVYEQLLTEYWRTPTAAGSVPKELAAQAFAASFREQLLVCRHHGDISSQEFRQLASLCNGDRTAPTDAVLRTSRLALVTGNQQPVKLAGLFLIEFTSAQWPDVLVYSVKQGLRRFTDVQALGDHFASALGSVELLEYTASADHPLLIAQASLGLRLDPLDQPPFGSVIDSLIEMQKRDLAWVLRAPGNTPGDAELRLDAALDIRGMLDRHLAAVEDAGRWSEAIASFERNWFQGQVFARHDSPVPTLAWRNEPDRSWGQYLGRVDSKVDEIFQARQGIHACARRVLDRYLWILQGHPLNAERVWVQWGSQAPVSLVSFFLERISGQRRTALPADCRVFRDFGDAVVPVALSHLTPTLLDQVLNRAQQGFAQTFAQQTRQLHSLQLRIFDDHLVVGESRCWFREGLLRLELDMELRDRTLRKQTLDMLGQVLDRPVASLRRSLGDAATEVSVPYLVYDPGQAPLQMTNIMVLQQPMQESDGFVVWSANSGLWEAGSLRFLELELNKMVVDPERRDWWLGCLSAPDRTRVEHALGQNAALQLKINLRRIDGHFIRHLQEAELERQCGGIEQAYQMALDCRMDADLFAETLNAAEFDDTLRGTLDYLTLKLESALFNALIPDWLRRATTQELAAFSSALRRFYIRSAPSEDFMFGIPSLGQYAFDQVAKRLRQDFPEVVLDPDRIWITLTRYTIGPSAPGQIPSSLPAASSVVSESLTGYAMNRFSGIHGASLRVSAQDLQLPAGLDAAYVRSLVGSLDIAAGYRRLLGQKLGSSDPDRLQRQRYFAQQMPSVLLLNAMKLRLEHLLSETAYRYIENVLDMPDGSARLPVNGRHIIVSPLQLLADADRAADRVTGVYLIAPQEPDQGPVILHAVAGDAFLFKEYASRQAFLVDLHISSTLQAMILDRLEPEVRPIYANGGFAEPHFPWSTESFSDLPLYSPAPVRLSIDPIQGNLLLRLYRDMAPVLDHRSRKSSVTTAENRTAASHFLLALGAEQVLAFLPGKLGALVGLWQSEQLFHASAISATQQRWGKAVSEFSAALGMLITSRQHTDEALAAGQEESVNADDTDALWTDAAAAPVLQIRLQRFEVQDISLNELHKDPLLDVYTDPLTLKQYAPVAGKVYWVQQRPSGWHIMGEQGEGPLLRMGTDQHWTLAGLGTRREGGAVTRLQSARMQRDIGDIFIVEARGMREIRRAYRDKARRIGEAHLQARRYLQNCLSNISGAPVSGRLDLRVSKIIGDFFGVSAPGEGLLLAIRTTVSDIFKLLLDPSLAPFSSDRFVVGSNRLGYEDSTAFTFSHDAQKRIFLTERYFRTPVYRLKRPRPGQGSFQLGVHYRATVLLHELSHLANDTQDIAYLDSEAPFLDLLDDQGEYRARLKLEQERYQQNVLSHRTPRGELFKLPDRDGQQGLKAIDGDGKRVVLRITGKTTLDEARDVFLNDAEKRAQIILSNADSVALLVTLLGRERLTSAP